MYKLNANKEVLNILVKDYLNAEKKSYIEKNSNKQIPFNSSEISSISQILAEQTTGTGINVKDIDKAVDEFLMRCNYAYEGADGFSKKYVAKSEENYYYYSLIELEIYGGARSVSEAMYLISKEIEKNLKNIKKNTELTNSNKIHLSIVKDNSTKYLSDSTTAWVMHGFYDIESDEVNLKSKRKNIGDICSGK